MSVNKKRIKCRKKFLYYFKKGFYDKTYLDWERNYKWQAHQEWMLHLNKKEFGRLLNAKDFSEIVQRAVRIESRTNLLFSFEKMALRDAVKGKLGSETFANALYDYIYGSGTLQRRFEEFCIQVAALPRKQTRVLTWPLLTVFGFIAKPDEFIFLKPRVTQEAAVNYDFNFEYQSRPDWKTYGSLLAFAEQIRTDNKDLKPRDYMDLQSFIWVMGSDEYP